MLALLPPKIRRGAVLIDPSYELKTEFTDVARLLGRASQRWPQGTYIVWYPILARERHLNLVEKLARLPQERKYHSELRWRVSASTRGLLGSGLIVLNAPWRFEVGFDASLATLASILSNGTTAEHESELL